MAGFFGMFMGMGLLYVVNIILTHAAQGNDIINYIFTNPSADFSVAITATVVLIIAGLVAGFIPARKASAIKPIEALRDE